METKLAAVRAYLSQVDEFRHDEAVDGLDGSRGAGAARCRYAEAYDQLDHNSGIGAAKRQTLSGGTGRSGQGERAGGTFYLFLCDAVLLVIFQTPSTRAILWKSK